MFSVLRKTKVIFRKLFFVFFESREAAKNSQQRDASSQRNRRKIGRINSKAGKKETSKNIRDGKQQTIASFFSRPAVQFPPVSQPPKRKPLLPLNLPNANVPKKRAADPAAESKAKKKLKLDAFNDDDEIAQRVDEIGIMIYWAPGTIYWVCPYLGTLKYNEAGLG